MATFRIFKFRHPKTGEIFSEFRNVKDAKKEFKSLDGVVCEPYGAEITSFKKGVVVKGKEGFEMYPGYYKEMNPKKVKYLDGHSEKFDPTKHC